jgi:two-component system LytT family response regulator
MRVLLVDDEALALDRLQVFCADIDGHRGGRPGARAATRRWPRSRRCAPDLVILDIQMPGRNGLRTAADIRVEPRPELVFVTAHEHYAPDAFDLEAADYILKPVRFDRLRLATDRARRRRQLREAAANAPAHAGGRGGCAACRRACRPARIPKSGCPSATGQRRVPIETIDWVEAARDYVLLHTELRSYMLRITMAALEEKLAGSGADPRAPLGLRAPVESGGNPPRPAQRRACCWPTAQRCRWGRAMWRRSRRRWGWGEVEA